MRRGLSGLRSGALLTQIGEGLNQSQCRRGWDLIKANMVCDLIEGRGLANVNRECDLVD